MSFAKDTENVIELAIKKEYEKCCDKYGETYNSLHEGYAILLEEVEEAEQQIIYFKEILDQLWSQIKINQVFDYTMSHLESSSKNAMLELAQVGAVLQKLQNTIQKVKE